MTEVLPESDPAGCQIIVAMDVPTREEALALLDQLEGRSSCVKIGLQLFTRYGPQLVEEVAARGSRIFLDLKLHDIPNTVASAIRSLAHLPIELLTLHGLGGPAMVQAAAERSAELTRQLLGFARKQTVVPQQIDLNEVVAGMHSMLTRLIGEDVEMAWNPGDALWPVYMDPAQIDQILMNLCVNSRDAIEGVGRVVIATENIVWDEAYCSKVEDSAPGEYVRLSISDDGHGIDSETLDNIFEPFFTTKETGKGTGLGLATVYGIVKQNDGFIHVTSEPGEGARFDIFLPRVKEMSDVSDEREKDVPTQKGNETILLVEDEPAVLEVAAMVLKQLGYTVLPESSPKKALQRAASVEGDVHLLITDVVMPEMNGRDLAEEIVSHFPDITCLFMSGYNADIIAPHGVLEEHVHFIQKPFSCDALAAKVREALES